MLNLIFLWEKISNSLGIEMLDVASFFAIFCAILVIISKNPIVSVLFLIGLFLCISCFLIILGTNFIGLSYLLVYVGAVSILFLFILMLINVRTSELLTDACDSIFLALMISIFIFDFVSFIIPKNIECSDILNWSLPFFKKVLDFTYNILDGSNILGTHGNNVLSSINEYDNTTNFITIPIWDGYLLEISHITSIGNTLYTIYSIWLILICIILLLAMVGAIVITLKNNNSKRD